MKFKVNSALQYSVIKPSTFIFNVHALRTANQTVLEETLVIDPYIRIEEFTAVNSPNRFVRMEVAEPMNFIISYKATVDTHCNIIENREGADTISLGKLDGEVIPYLFPSRYCQSDKLQRLAYSKFGNIQNTFHKVHAISDWIFKNVEYISGSTNSHTSALDTISERSGVCRDFAHLGIALCRALSIPARYFTGYAFKLFPADFHACFEAYIGERWIVFDATQLVPLNGMVKIASGRDAADAAVASIFGNVISTSIAVSCDIAEQTFEPIWYDNSNARFVAY